MIYHRKEWKNTRLQIIKRDEYKCSNCGSTITLQVHHINGDTKNNNPGNLITLCAKCHLRIESEIFARKNYEEQEKIRQKNKTKTINSSEILRENNGKN